MHALVGAGSHIFDCTWCSRLDFGLCSGDRWRRRGGCRRICLDVLGLIRRTFGAELTSCKVNFPQELLLMMFELSHHIRGEQR